MGSRRPAGRSRSRSPGPGAANRAAPPRAPRNAHFGPGPEVRSYKGAPPPVTGFQGPGGGKNDPGWLAEQALKTGATRMPPPNWLPLPPSGNGADEATARRQQEGPKWAFVTLFVLSQIGMYLFNSQKFIEASRPLFELLGVNFALARGGAGILLLDAALILLPVSRNLITLLRNTPVAALVPLDKNIQFHKMCAYGLVVGAAIHMCAHYFNFRNIWFLDDYDTLNIALGAVYVRHVSFIDMVFFSIPGVTGHGMLLCMVLMYASAWKKVKRNGRGNFEVFWYTHHLFLPFFAFLMLHGASNMLDPVNGKPSAWMWVCGPLALYLFERIVRIYRAGRGTRILKIVNHPAGVVEVQWVRDIGRFHYQCGEYIFINCPYVSEYQWHPFTISSAPEDPYVSVHIRQAGDWTTKFAQVMVPGNRKERMDHVDLAAPSTLQVDGPFGAASDEVFMNEVAVLVGAGVGVTPFASILRSINHRIKSADRHAKLSFVPMSKVYFYWICKDVGTFEWFSEMLKEMEKHGIGSSVEIRIHLTDKEIQRKTMAGLRRDPLTGLKAPTKYGRPDWEKEFWNIYMAHPGRDIGVFVCGPGPLSREVRRNCFKFSDNFTMFKFAKENF